MIKSSPGRAVLPLLLVLSLFFTASSFSISKAASLQVKSSDKSMKETDGEFSKTPAFPAEVIKWDILVNSNAKFYNLDANLIYAIIWVESAGNPQAYSSSGAVGLMQIMPRDGLAAGFKCGSNPCFMNRPLASELWPPAVNIAYGCKLLREYISQYSNIREALKHYGPMDVGYSYADKIIEISGSFSNN